MHTPVERGYGFKPSPKDPRDFKKSFTEKSILKFKTSHNLDVDLSTERFNLTDIMTEQQKDAVSYIDQGSLGSCTANATSFAYFFDEIKQKNKYIFFPSRLFLYYNERVLTDTVDIDSGASLRDALNAMRKFGICREKIWPYQIKYYKVRPPPLVYKEAIMNNKIKYKRIDFSRCFTVKDRLIELKKCLLSGYPFVYGFKVYPSFQSTITEKTGIMSMPNQSESYIVGHAVCAIGFDDNFKNSGKGYFIVKNSWGKNWGDNGYFYMPYEYITNDALCFLEDFWILKEVSKSGMFCTPEDIYPCTSS
jgi:C1A family cysteine protease